MPLTVSTQHTMVLTCYCTFANNNKNLCFCVTVFTRDMHASLSIHTCIHAYKCGRAIYHWQTHRYSKCVVLAGGEHHHFPLYPFASKYWPAHHHAPTP